MAKNPDDNVDNSEDKDADVNVSSTFYFKLSNNSNLVTISSIYAVPIDASGAPISSSVGLSKGQSYNWNISAVSCPHYHLDFQGFDCFLDRFDLNFHFHHFRLAKPLFAVFCFFIYNICICLRNLSFV